MSVTQQVANGSNCCNMNVDLLQSLQATIDLFGLKILYISSKMECANESTNGQCDLFGLKVEYKSLKMGCTKETNVWLQITNNYKWSFTLICGICVVWLEVVKSCFASEKGWMLKRFICVILGI